MRILTTYPIPESKEWINKTYLVPIKGKSGLFGIKNWCVPFKLIFLRKNFDVIITGTEREDELFAFLQTFLVFGKIKHIMIDCLWKKEKNTFRRFIKTLLLKIISKSVTYFVVWSSEEKEKYPQEFGLAKEKFIFLPHHSTLSGYKVDVKEGDYIFAGGNSSRDYITLIKAVKGLGLKTIIALTNYRIIDGIDIPENVTVRTATPQEFRNLMAQSEMVIIPQTYLNAMMLRKPIVVSNAPGVRNYIGNGKTGIIVPAGDVETLRNSILEIINNNGKIDVIVENAYKKASSEFTLEKFVERNLSLAEKIC